MGLAASVAPGQQRVFVVTGLEDDVELPARVGDPPGVQGLVPDVGPLELAPKARNSPFSAPTKTQSSRVGGLALRVIRSLTCAAARSSEAMELSALMGRMRRVTAIVRIRRVHSQLREVVTVSRPVGGILWMQFRQQGSFERCG